MLKVSDKAVDFKLKDSNNNDIILSDFKGKKIILYFYPKDFTPGCTKEACDFRDNFNKFKNMVIIGISSDSVELHKKFIAKLNLPFILLSDVNKEVAKKYKVYKKKKFYGKEYFGIERTTFIIAENLKIESIFRKVKVDNHIKEVLNAIK